MVSVLIAIPFLTVAFFLLIHFRYSPSNPVRFARMIAKQQRLVLKTIIKADPGLSRKKAYLKTMRTRTPHQEEELLEIIKQAGSQAGPGEPLRFNDLVSRLVIQEYKKRVPPEKQKTDMFPAMEDAVRTLISNDV